MGKPRSRSRDRDREYHSEKIQRDRSHRHGSLPEGVIENWQRHVDTFVEVNGLDERSAGMLGELSKLMVLRVIGLVGRENSFVIRGARNPSAAVTHRLKGAADPAGSVEPFANLNRLVEDFIEVNEFDERGAEAVRELRAEEVLHVMGFTGENSFVIRGAKNVSASLMSRLTLARKYLREEAAR